jgi:hypothetical protein
MAEAWFHSTMASPIGELMLLADETCLIGLPMQYPRHLP